MSDQTKPTLNVSFDGLSEAAVYKADFDGELMNAAAVKAEALACFSPGVAAAAKFLAKLEPASEEETQAYLTGLVVQVEALRREFAAEVERLTGCNISVNVGIHSCGIDQYPLFKPAASITGVLYGQNNGSQWYAPLGDKHGQTSVFGPTLKEAAK